MASKAAKSPKSRGKQSSERRRRSPTKEASRSQPIAPTGIEIIDAAENDPGMPDSVDVAETARPMSPQAAKSTEIAGGDLDGSFGGLDGGEEAVGGSDPLPDQNDVDRIGSALGVEEQDEKPLATTEKLEGRDRDRWELDPASADDYDLRQREETARRRQRRP